MNVQDKKIITMGNKSLTEEVNAVRKAFASLLLANKNVLLYPQGHTICTNSIQQFHTQLRACLHKYGDLRLEIERDRVISQGEVISSGLPEEGSLPFILFRDGIRWLEFTDGIEPEEIQDILMIINKYRTLSTEPEGDIVTAFWEAQLPHMQYEVADFSWAGEQEVENRIPALTTEKMKAPLREKHLEEPESPNDPVIDQASLVLTPQEQAMLQEMIRHEEEADLTSYLDALLDSLLQHREKKNFSIILEVLSEEFTGSLDRREFLVTLKILQGLRHVHDICKTEIPWAGTSIEGFLLTASGFESLKPLEEVWEDIHSEQAGILGHIFKLLNPQAIYTLAHLLQQPQPLHLRQMLMDAMITLALQDMRPLESLLNNSDEKLMETLVPILVNLEGERSLKHLMKLVRHASARVRHEAIKGIVKRNPAHVKDVFNLIDDKDEAIRRLFLKQLGQSRNAIIEGLLMEYLGNRKFSIDQADHVLACFRTLGQCGSSRSIPFLRKTLLECRWMPSFWRFAHRMGAAVALGALGIPEAEQALKDAGRSLAPSLRDIVRKAKPEP